MAAGKGWIAGGSVDHPCGVFLTDRAVYVDVRPDASVVGGETIAIPFDWVEKCGLGASDRDSPRLVIVFTPAGGTPDDVRGVSIDLRPHAAGQRFGQQVVAQVERVQDRGAGGPSIRDLQEAYANRVAHGAQLLAEYSEINAIYGMLRDRGADADPDLIEEAKLSAEEWMQENPWLEYHEPHLNRDWFDENRPDKSS